MMTEFGVYEAGPQMEPQELREIQQGLGLTTDQVSYALRWPGLDGRQIRRMKNDRRLLDVPGPVAGWLREVWRVYCEVGGPEGWAVLARPPEPPPMEERFWNRRRELQAEREAEERRMVARLEEML